MTRARRNAATVLLVVLAAVGGAGPSSADERVVRIGRDGVQPQVLRVRPGDTVRFVSADPTFAYRAQSTGGPWRFDSGPTALLQGDYVVPGAVTRPGTYTYRVAQDAPYSGSVVVGDGAPASAPPAPAPPGTAPPASAAPAVAPPSPAVVAAPSVRGPLAGAPNDRALGLAVAVAVVLLGGAASLLLRLLLAVPVPAPVLSDPPARL